MLAPIRLNNAAAQVGLRTQVRRKETHLHPSLLLPRPYEVLYRSYASVGFMLSCTTLLTAWIMLIGLSLWKIFLPRSPPPAPSCIARYPIANSSHSFRFFLPPLTS